MKKRVGLGALVVLAGVVILGALLMWGPFDNAPSASATEGNVVPLGVGRNHDDVGDVTVVLNAEGVHVDFTADSGYLEEVHACVWDAPEGCCDGDADGPPWVPPGNERKCNEAGGAFGAAECGPMATSCSIDIDWDDVPWAMGPECHNVRVQAHAAMMVDCESETAYGGESFKGNFCLTTPCCL